MTGEMKYVHLNFTPYIINTLLKFDYDPVKFTTHFKLP